MPIYLFYSYTSKRYFRGKLFATRNVIPASNENLYKPKISGEILAHFYKAGVELLRELQFEYF